MDSAFCGLHNDKYTKNSPHKNCVNRAFLHNRILTEISMD